MQGAQQGQHTSLMPPGKSSTCALFCISLKQHT